MDDVFDLIVLGAGSGGLAAAKRAASYGAKVAIVEGDRVGGTCVIRGCVPKKLLVYGSQYVENLKDASSFGVNLSNPSINPSTLLANVRKEVDRLNQLHIQLLEKSGVELMRGWGTIATPHSVHVDPSDGLQSSKELSAKNILIAVGGKPVRPDIPGSSLGWDSNEIFLQKSLPKKIVIIGAGFIACEFACILVKLGIEVTQLVRGDTLLKGFDKDLSSFLKESLDREGINLKFNNTPLSLKGEKGDIQLMVASGEKIDCGAVLFATGRKPYLEKLNLHKIGIEHDSKRIKVDLNNATNIPNIFAVGDVANKVNLTPVAIEEGRLLADKIFGKKNKNIDYEMIPKAVFSQPEIASVGLTEEQAKNKFGTQDIKIFRSMFRPMSQSLQKSERKCLLKLVINKKDNIILGCHMAGEHSSEIIQMASIAIAMGAKKDDFDKTMALHPTVAEEFVTMS